MENRCKFCVKDMNQKNIDNFHAKNKSKSINMYIQENIDIPEIFHNMFIINFF